MKKITLLLLVSMICCYSSAQTREIDSLKKSLQKEKSDTGRVLSLAELSFLYLELNPDTTLELAMQALSIARSSGFEKGEAVSLNRLGNAYRALGNYPAALRVYLQALRINEKTNNPDGKQRNLNNIGVIYSLTGDHRLALEYLFNARDLSRNIGEKKSLSVALVNIGQCYQRMKVYDSARTYVQQSYDMASTVDYQRTMGAAYTFMGEINLETGQHNLAAEYYRLSIPYSTNVGNNERLSDAYLGIAKVFEKKGENDSVLFYAKQALIVTEGKGFMKEHLNASIFLSSFYQTRRNADSALLYLHMAKAANDSLFNLQNQRQLQTMAFDEKLRQQEIAATELKAEEERKHNLQYAAIAVGLITFIILFILLSRSIIVKEKFIKFFGILGLLAVFEFINLYIHPHLDRITDHSPVFMLAILMCIAALLIPLHHKLEKWITKIMVEKNKKIRLAAAKKTIATLEGEQIN